MSELASESMSQGDRVVSPLGCRPAGRPITEEAGS
jgi:hypothetical protein